MYNPHDERLNYAVLIAKEFIEPKLQYDCDTDTTMLSYYFIMDTFVKRLDKNLIDFASKRAQFEDSEDIIATVEGYEMDIEQFWHAVLFVYDYVEQTCTKKKTKWLPSAYHSLVELHNYLVENPKSTLTVAKPKATKKDSLQIDNNPIFAQHLIEAISQYIDRQRTEPMNDDKIDDFEDRLCVLLDASDLENLSIQRCMVVKMFMALFKALGLPDKQAGKGDYVSFNKMLLISRLCYFYKLTDTDSYTVEEDALEKSYQKYKDKKVEVALSSVYLIG